MRFSTSGSLRRIDISLLIAVVGPLRTEWAGLRFDPSGALVNALSGEPMPDFRLIEGAHRKVGARYEVVGRTPVMEPDPARLRALDAELLGVPDTDWDEYYRRRESISVQTGVTETTTTFTLRADDARTLAVTVTDPDELWAVEIDITHGRLPRIEVSGRLDVTEMLAHEMPGCLSRILGGTASGAATIDLGALEARRGALADGSGGFNRFRGEGGVTVKTSARSWSVKAKGRLRARGLGRPVLLFGGRRLRRAVNEAVEDFWRDAPTSVDTLERTLRHARPVVEAEGGVAAMLHQALWDPAYAERMDDLLDPE